MTSDPKYQHGDPPHPREAHPEAIVSPDALREQRVPPGQTRTRKWPVLHWGSVAHVRREDWRITIDGLVDRPLTLDWAAFRELPRARVFGDFHCVTRWSRLGNHWEGAAVRPLLESCGIQPEARFAVIGGYDGGWTTNLPLADLLADDVLLVDLHDGEPLDDDHGGPVRLIVPRLYAWKSAKWIRSITLTAEDAPGYWEQAGYHNRGCPWAEERFGG